MTVTIRFPFPGSIRIFQVVCFSFDSLFLAAICKCSVLNTSPSSELPGNNISSLCSSAWSLVSGTWNMNKTSLCALISNSTPQTHSSVPKVETLWRPNEDADNQRSRRRLISKQKKGQHTGSPSYWGGKRSCEGEGVLLSVSVSRHTSPRGEDRGRSW